MSSKDREKGLTYLSTEGVGSFKRRFHLTKLIKIIVFLLLADFGVLLFADFASTFVRVEAVTVVNFLGDF